MVNRYVNGLAAIAPDDPAVYATEAQRLVMEGYLAPPAAPEREGTSRCGCAHTIIATPALGAITMLPARRQMWTFASSEADASAYGLAASRPGSSRDCQRCGELLITARSPADLALSPGQLI
jgi:hypothetical protein